MSQGTGYVSALGQHAYAAATHPDEGMRGYHVNVMGHMIKSHPAYGQFNKMKNTATKIVGSSPVHAQNLMNHARKGNFLGGLKSIADKRNMRGVFDNAVSGIKPGFEKHVNNLAQATATAKNRGLSGFSLFNRKTKTGRTGSFKTNNPMFARGGKRKTAKRKTAKRKTVKRKTKKNRRH